MQESAVSASLLPDTLAARMSRREPAVVSHQRLLRPELSPGAVALFPLLMLLALSLVDDDDDRPHISPLPRTDHSNDGRASSRRQHISFTGSFKPGTNNNKNNFLPSSFTSVRPSFLLAPFSHLLRTYSIALAPSRDQSHQTTTQHRSLLSLSCFFFSNEKKSFPHNGTVGR